MDRNSYILELRKHLKGIPESEIKDILAYYEEYFAEAGVENEEKVIADLGAPKDAAMKILGDYTIKNAESDEIAAKKWTKMIWMIILGIFASPIALPVAIALVVVIIALIIALAAVIIALFSVAFSLLIGGILSVIGGLCLITTELPTTIFFLGFGGISVGASILLSLGVFAFGRFSLRAISGFAAKCFKRRSGI